MHPHRVLRARRSHSPLDARLNLATGAEVAVGVFEVPDGGSDVGGIEVGLFAVELAAEDLHDVEEVLALTSVSFRRRAAQEEFLVLKDFPAMLIGTLGIHADDVRDALADLPDVLATGVHGDVGGLELQTHHFLGRNRLFL